MFHLILGVILLTLVTLGPIVIGAALAIVIRDWIVSGGIRGIRAMRRPAMMRIGDIANLFHAPYHDDSAMMVADAKVDIWWD